MQIHNAIITGSFSYNGADLSNVTSSNAYSASLSSRTTDLESTSSVLVGASSSFSLILSSVSSSQQQISASLLQVSASYTALSGSYNTFSGSASTRVTQIEQVYATTGSNSFRANQSITGSLVVSSTITAQTLVVQTVTSSIVFSSGSNTFGNQLANNQTFTGSVNITGSLALAGNITGNAITLTGALSGTSATFSGLVNFGTIASGTTNNFTQLITTSDTGKGMFNGIDITNRLFYWRLNDLGDYGYSFQNNTGTNFFKIASTGAATFSSSVTATQFTSAGGRGTNFGFKLPDWQIYNTSSGNALAFSNYTSDLLYITSGGNVLIGTTTDTGYKLNVNGSARIVGGAIVDRFITDSATVSIPYGSFGTFYTVQNYQNAIYLVTLQLNGYSNYTAYATIVQNDSSLVIMNQVNNVAQIQVSGLNIQGQNGSGITQSMVYKIIKIS